MPLNIRSEAVNQLAGALAARLKTSKTEAVRQALQAELHRFDRKLPLLERIRPLQDDILSHGTTGLPADKAFYDDLSGET
jgi:antitoxin VapB